VGRQCLERLGLTVTQAAESLGVTRRALSDVVNERAGISVEMADPIVEGLRLQSRNLARTADGLRPLAGSRAYGVKIREFNPGERGAKGRAAEGRAV
jgi:transcriptional regulator with XRE-family HTH domain